MAIRLVAFDLDDTLLNSQKIISPETLKALELAHAQGIELVPVTGRFWSVVPECVRSLDFIRYAVLVNGAEIYDVKNSKVLARFEIPYERAVTMAHVFDDLPVIYDVVIGGQGWMRREYYARISDYTVGEWQTKVIESSRKPVDDIYELLTTLKQGIQKIQILAPDKELHERLLASLPVVFPKNIISSSVVNNIEINDIHANKGDGLRYIASLLDIPIAQTMAFGDGTNDIYMIRAAGVGVAMSNAYPEVLEAADYVTSSNDNDGVAEGIKRFCF